MAEMMKKEFLTKLYIFIVMIGLIAFLSWMFHAMQTSPLNVTNFSTGWAVTYHGETRNDVDLSEHAFEGLKRGDVVVLRNTLPDSIITGTQIRVYTGYAVINVYVAGKDEYTYGYGFDSQDRVIPGVYHRITLVKAQAGKDIKIQYQVKDDDPFTILPTIYIGDAEGIYGKFIQDNLFALSVGVVLTLVGFLLSVITCILAFRKSSIAIIFYAANFALLMGIWSLADMLVLNLILNNPEVTYLIKYIALYLCPISIVLIFREININRPKWRAIFLGSAIVDYLFCGVTFFLYYKKLFHINESLIFLHLLIAIEIVLAFRSVFTKFSLQRRKDVYLTFGLTSFSMLVCLDMFRFNMDLYAASIGLSFHMRSSFMPFGALVFLVCIFLCYAFDVTDQRKAEEERNRLQELAYRDRLTNLYNRQKCDEILREKITGNKKFTIINFDLNELKTTNDTKGHLYGDLLISGFAKILEKVFQQKNNAVGRMGGDEFLAILEITDTNEVQKLLRTLEELMKIESKNGDIYYSCAYGIANSDEVEQEEDDKHKTSVIYELADKRMYEMKRKQKEISKTLAQEKNIDNKGEIDNGSKL